MTDKKKRFTFPSAYTVILLILLAVMILTYFIPAGKYASLQYNTTQENFTVVAPNGHEATAPGTQATLKK